MNLKSHFSKDVYHARKNKPKLTPNEPKLTQQRVAEDIHICLREYQKIEKGELLPRTEIFLRLVFYFNLDIQSYREDVFKKDKEESS